MFGSTILEVGAGVVFVYFVLSIICTSLNETIAQLIGLRSENLYESIHGLFSGPDRHRIADDLYNHPTIQSLRRKTLGQAKLGANPASIAPSAFSLALMSLLGVKEPDGAQTDSSGQLADVFTNPKYDAEVMSVIQPLINSANGNLDKARRNIETWFEHAMNRSSDWYKRKAQIMTLVVATALVTISNADTIMIMDRLWANPVQRAQIENASKNQKDASAVSKVARDATLSLIGWSEKTAARKKGAPYDRRTIPVLWDDWMAKIMGLMITIFAVSLGAPFWFDKLSLIMNIRAGGKPSEAPAGPGQPPGGTGTPNQQTARIPSSDAGVNP